MNSAYMARSDYGRSIVAGTESEEKRQVRRQVLDFLLEHRPTLKPHQQLRYVGMPGPQWVFEKQYLLERISGKNAVLLGIEGNNRFLQDVLENAPRQGNVVVGDLWAPRTLEMIHGYNMAWFDTCNSIHWRMLDGLQKLGDAASIRADAVPIAVTISAAREKINLTKELGHGIDHEARVLLVAEALDRSKKRSFDLRDLIYYQSGRRGRPMLVILGLLHRRTLETNGEQKRAPKRTAKAS